MAFERSKGVADRPDPGALEHDAHPRRRPRLLIGGVAAGILVLGGVAGGVALTHDDPPGASETGDKPSTASDRAGDEGKVVPLDSPYVLVAPLGFAIVGEEHVVPDYEFDVPGPRSTVDLRTDGGAEVAISLIREFRRGALVDAAKALPDARVTQISVYDADGRLVAQEAVRVPAGVYDERAHLVWQGAEHRGFDASFDEDVTQRERNQVVGAIRWSPAPPADGIRIDAPLPVGWAAVAGPLYVDIGLDQRTPRAEASAATFDVRPEPSRVCDLPVAALERLGPDDAFVSVVDAMLGDPRSRPPATDFLPLEVPINLVPEGERDLTTELCLVRQPDFRFNETSFAENGRIVRVFVGIGLEASAETVAQVLDVVNRIVVEPPR